MDGDEVGGVLVEAVGLPLGLELLAFVGREPFLPNLLQAFGPLTCTQQRAASVT